MEDLDGLGGGLLRGDICCTRGDGGSAFFGGFEGGENVF